MAKLRIPKNRQQFQTLSHARAPVQERDIASRFGGRTVRGSGCGYEKGDARIKGVMRIETKTTSAQSFSVTRDMIKKIEDAAINSGEVPALIVEFNDDGKKVSEVAIVPVWVLEMIVGSNGSS